MSILNSIILFIYRFILALYRTIGGHVSREAIEKDLDARAAAHFGPRLDWRNSVVDLLKLTDQDSSLEARKALALRYGYDGPLDGSAEMNLWLHNKVMEKLQS